MGLEDRAGGGGMKCSPVATPMGIYTLSSIWFRNRFVRCLIWTFSFLVTFGCRVCSLLPFRPNRGVSLLG